MKEGKVEGKFVEIFVENIINYHNYYRIGEPGIF